MLRRTRFGTMATGLALVLATAAACAPGSDRTVATGATTPSTATATATTNPHVTQHAYRAGESFTYFYDSTAATYATQQAQNGQVVRVTDLQTISDVRAMVRFSVVNQNGTLAKKVELLDTRFRDISKDAAQPGQPAIPFKKIQTAAPNFPATFSYTYPLNGENDVARNLNTIFKDYPDPHLVQLIDIFSLFGAPASIPSTVGVGQVTSTPGVDVDLLGTTYHSAGQVLLFERVDRKGTTNQAYFKNQGLGNYFNGYGVDTNVHSTYHVALNGPASGLLAGGDLSETAIQGGVGGAPRTATQRQVSLTLQNLDTRSAVDSYGPDLKPIS